MSNLPQIMIMGSYYMANPNHAHVRTEIDDLLTPERQKEVEALCDRLRGFAPTHIAVEYEPAACEQLNADYQLYRKGHFALKSNEVYQFGFRLAAASGHEALYGIDYQNPGAQLTIADVLRYAAEHSQIDLVDRFQQDAATMQQASAMVAEMSLSEIYQRLNAPETDAFTHKIYLLLGAMGDSTDPIGARWVSSWYERNLRIYANIAFLARSAQDHILVLIGSGHRTLLREFITGAPHLEYVSIEKYLD